MKLEIVSLGLIFFTVLVITLGIIKIHTYPGVVAKARNHPQTKAIEVTSLLGLLMFPLWMAALVWAYSDAVIGKLYEQPADDPASPSRSVVAPEPNDRGTASDTTPSQDKQS